MQNFQLIKNNQQIRLIIGLGNVGEQHQHNRHNIGFLFVDFLIHIYFKNLDISPEFQETKENKIYTFRELDLVILKPKLMMNLSGEAIYEFIKYKEYSLKEILVIHDDLDISFRSSKLQLLKSPKLHNGISSIESVLTGKDFYRLRLGIENRNGIPIPGKSYVLSNFTAEEMNEIDRIFNDILSEEFIIK